MEKKFNIDEEILQDLKEDVDEYKEVSEYNQILFYNKSFIRTVLHTTRLDKLTVF